MGCRRRREPAGRTAHGPLRRLGKPGRPVGTRLRGGREEGAQARVFDERIEPPVCLSIFGAGDDARPLARLARELGWRVTVADPRPAMPTAGRFPGAAALLTGPADDLVRRAAPPAGSLAVVMTHHYVHDVPLLRDLLPLPLAYLGLLGSPPRAERIIADLEEKGLRMTPEMRRA